MITELLNTGRENARTGQELADMLGITYRELTAAIERERRAGAPICAATGRPQGYYIAANEQELRTYCDQLRGRAIEVFKTRQALVNVLRALAESKEEQ